MREGWGVICCSAYISQLNTNRSMMDGVWQRLSGGGQCMEEENLFFQFEELDGVFMTRSSLWSAELLLAQEKTWLLSEKINAIAMANNEILIHIKLYIIFLRLSLDLIFSIQILFVNKYA